MKRLIVTADDFGLSTAVNEAVELAHTTGILTAASLIVTAPAATDAIERARRLPALGVGLHLVFVDGIPALPPAQIPDLVGADGRFQKNPTSFGVRLFFSRRIQRQLAAEMRAQFELFRATGLALDHVNGHHHFHQHPTIVGMLIALAREVRINAVRVPHEPFGPSHRAQRDHFWRRWLGGVFPITRLTGMRARLRAAGVASNEHLFGLHDSGRMTAARISRYLDELPDGVSELYSHPATTRWTGPDNLPATYLCIEEYAALADPRLRARLEHAGIERISFSALASPV